MPHLQHTGTRQFVGALLLAWSPAVLDSARGQEVDRSSEKPRIVAPNGHPIRPSLTEPRLYLSRSQFQWAIDFLAASPDQAAVLNAAHYRGSLDARAILDAYRSQHESGIDQMEELLISGVGGQAAEDVVARVVRTRNRKVKELSITLETEIRTRGEEILVGSQLNRLPLVLDAIRRWHLTTSAIYIVPECRHDPVHFVMSRASIRGALSPGFTEAATVVLWEHSPALTSLADAMLRDFEQTKPRTFTTSRLISTLTPEELREINLRWRVQAFRTQDRYARLADEVVERLTAMLPASVAADIRFEWNRIGHPATARIELGLRQRLLALTPRTSDETRPLVQALQSVNDSAIERMQEKERAFFTATMSIGGFVAFSTKETYVIEMLSLRAQRVDSLLAVALELRDQTVGADVEEPVSSLIDLLQAERAEVGLLRESEPLAASWPP
jgi:hypothetical protein